MTLNTAAHYPRILQFSSGGVVSEPNDITEEIPPDYLKRDTRLQIHSYLLEDTPRLLV
jgi:hypothetical protein